MDVTSVTTAITGASTAIATVSGAVLVMCVGLKAYKWVKYAVLGLV